MKITKLRERILTVIVTAVVTLMLFGGNRAPATRVEAQTSGGKSDLITLAKQWAANCKKLDDDGQSITATWNQISASITSPDDFTGSNAGLTKTQMTAVITTISNMHSTYISGNNTNVEVFR